MVKMNKLTAWNYLVAAGVALVLMIISASAVFADSPSVKSIEYTPAKTDITVDVYDDYVDKYWKFMDLTNINPRSISEPGFYGERCDSYHNGDILTVNYDNGEVKEYYAETYIDLAGGSGEYAYFIAWCNEKGEQEDLDVSYTYRNYPYCHPDGRIPGTYDTKVTVSYAGKSAAYEVKYTVVGKRINPVTVKAKTVKVKASQLKKRSRVIDRKKAMTMKQVKGTVSFRKLSGNKKLTINKKTGNIKIGKNLKKGTYKLKVQVICKGNRIYDKAKRNVTIKVKVR